MGVKEGYIKKNAHMEVVAMGRAVEEKGKFQVEVTIQRLDHERVYRGYLSKVSQERWAA